MPSTAGRASESPRLATVESRVQGATSLDLSTGQRSIIDDDSPVSAIVGGCVAALAILGATVVALTYTCRTTGGGPRHARVRIEPDDAREVELQGPIVRRSSHLVDGEPPLAIAEALPLAEAVSVTARLVDTSDIDPSVDPFPRFASRGGLGELDAKL